MPLAQVYVPGRFVVAGMYVSPTVAGMRERLDLSRGRGWSGLMHAVIVLISGVSVRVSRH